MEVSAYLFGQMEIDVVIMDLRRPSPLMQNQSLGLPENTRLWQYLKIVKLYVRMKKGERFRLAVAERLKRFVQAIDGGKHLKNLTIEFQKVEGEALAKWFVWEPSWFPDAVEQLKAIRVDGSVKIQREIYYDVEYYGDEEEDEVCAELQRVISGELDDRAPM